MADVINLARFLFSLIFIGMVGTFASVVTLTTAMWLIQSGRLTFP